MAGRPACGRRKDGTEFPAEASIPKFVANGEVLFTATVRDVTERTRYEAAGRELDRLRADAQSATAAAQYRQRRAGVREPAGVRLRRRSGVDAHVGPAGDGEPGGFRGAPDMFTDMTDRRKAEEGLRDATRQLWQAARLAGVGKRAASIAHELNNPLATVSVRVERAARQDGGRRPPPAVARGGRPGDRGMAGLVGDLLQHSRTGRPPRTWPRR